MTRARRAAAVLTAAFALAACQPQPSPTTPAPTASPSPAALDLTQPGAAQRVLEQLAAAAGTRRLVKADVTADSAQVVAVVDKTAHTWAWRDGAPVEVDGDTQYIGQAEFSLDDFDLRDVGAIFRRAAALSGSSSRQQLQIVEYYDGAVYLTVGTSPESSTVFFRADGEPIPTLDYTTVAGLRRGLADARLGLTQVQQAGFSRATGVWFDTPAGDAGTRRVVRPARFPARGELQSTRRDWPTFSPALVQPEAVQRVVAQLDPDASRDVRVEIDRRDGMSDPTMTFTVDGTTMITDLAGNDITGQVRR